MEHISVTDPIGLAMERVRQVLFSPFDLGKWFTIGFCAWLSLLGERGYRANFNVGNGSNRGGDARQQFEHGRAYIMENLSWILPLAIFVIVLCLALWVLFIRLNSRGKFMFLHCVALNRAEVVIPWNRYFAVGNSLFWFQLVLGLSGMAVILMLLVLMVLAAAPMFLHDSWNFAGILTLVAIGGVMIVVAIFFALVRKLTTDFVVPIMFLRGSRCLDAWKGFWQLLTAKPGHFALYILFQIVIALAIGLIVVVAMIITCCIACCVMIIPYIGTVLLLPVILFKRAYTLYYFAQYGPAYDVFQPPATASV